MQWNIPEVPATLVPEVKNKWGKPWMWAATLAFACCCSLLWILLLKKYAIYSLVFPVIWFAALSYRYISSVHRYAAMEAWQKEKDNIRRKWTEWAGKRVAVIDAYVALPSEIALNDVIAETKGNERFDCIAFIDEENNFERPLCHETTVWQLEERIRSLAEFSKKLTVHIHTPDNDIYEAWQNKLINMSETIGIENLDLVIMPLQDMSEFINNWFEKSEPEGIHAVLSAWLNPDIDDLEFTETVTWIVFSSQHLAKQNNLPIRAWVQRPITLDDGKQPQLLKKYVDYGLHGEAVDAVWFASSHEEIQQYMDGIKAAGGDWHYDRNSVLRHNPGLFMGPLASENQLLMLGLAVENTEQKNQLFGWNTDNGFYMGRLIQAYGNV
ncbi:hypothetical protein KCG53_03215 [Neisseria subflava]|uniref:Uncharacterized protein n=1 Tax=Neisseria subflava TaxID=28449 RepID=A0A9X9N7G3_NEISU|nr:hypothetical protein [uncultured Neisseria sp.]UTG75992.1 hypothetical protein KCG53_03215 [Neisseria subflava]